VTEDERAQESRVGIEAAYGSGRVTLQRRHVARAAAELGSFTVEELAAYLSGSGAPVPLATIYRAVRAAEAAGSVQVVGKRAASELYVWCERSDHHHHLVCTTCGAVEHAPCPFDKETGVPTDVAGFKVTRHEMTLYGLCPACLVAERAG
jgi:Fur family transcriptional regulator, ferric uptake regulator